MEIKSMVSLVTEGKVHESILSVPHHKGYV